MSFRSCISDISLSSPLHAWEGALPTSLEAQLPVPFTLDRSHPRCALHQTGIRRDWCLRVLSALSLWALEANARTALTVLLAGSAKHPSDSSAGFAAPQPSCFKARRLECHSGIVGPPHHSRTRNTDMIDTDLSLPFRARTSAGSKLIITSQLTGGTIRHTCPSSLSTCGTTTSSRPDTGFRFTITETSKSSRMSEPAS